MGLVKSSLASCRFDFGFKDKRKITTAQESVLFSDFLLPMILNHVSIPDLKTCRLVHSTWYEAASKLILKYPNLTEDIHLIRIWSSLKEKEKDGNVAVLRKRIHNNNSVQSHMKPKHLSKLIQNSHIFPCSSFHFGDVNLTNANFEHFVNENGKYMKQVSFSYLFLFGQNSNSNSIHNQNQNQSEAMNKIRDEVLYLFEKLHNVEIVTISLVNSNLNYGAGDGAGIDNGIIQNYGDLNENNDSAENSLWDKIHWNNLKILNVTLNESKYLSLDLFKRIFKASPNLRNINTRGNSQFPQCMFNDYISLDTMTHK